jgi:hypothetical protein
VANKFLRRAAKAAAPATKGPRRAIVTRFVARVANAREGELESLDGWRARLLVATILRLVPLQYNRRGARDLAGAVEWRISEPDGGASVHTLTLRDRRCRMRAGIVAEPDLTIGLQAADFLRLVAGLESGPKLFGRGRLYISGDLGLALKLPRAFRVPRAGEP